MTKSSGTKPPPPRWKLDRLSEHFDRATENIWATFAKKKPQQSRMSAIDDAFFKLADGIENARTDLEGLFLLRSHVAFRAAAMLTYSTQIPEAYPLLRSCLECALYGLHIHVNPSTAEVWANRSSGKKEMTATRNEFTYGKVKRTLETKDAPLARQIDTLYLRTIDFGAHPNELGFFGAMTKETTGGKTTYKQSYFSGDGLSLDHALKTAASVGVGVLLVFQIVWKERFQILDLDQRLAKLKKGL